MYKKQKLMVGDNVGGFFEYEYYLKNKFELVMGGI